MEGPYLRHWLKTWRRGRDGAPFMGARGTTTSLLAFTLAGAFVGAGAGAASADEQGVKVEWDPGPKLSFMDGRFTVQLRGQLQIDYVYVAGARGAIDDSDIDARRARLGIEGEIGNRLEYEFEVDFADDGVAVTDAFVAVRAIGPLTFVVGQFETPNSFSEQTSSEVTTFMERPQFTDAFNLDRRLGVAARLDGERWHVKAGAFFQNIDTENGAVPDKNTWGAVAARGHYAFALADGDWFHLGTSIRYRDCDNTVDSASACGDGEVRYRERPFFRSTSVRTVDTETIEDMRSDLFWGPEIGVFYGPFAFKSEAGLLWGSRDNADADDFGPLWGVYADVAYFLTGESQPYDEKRGELDRPKIKNPVFKGGWGAWEIAARFDYLSLEDDGSAIDGGRQWIVVAGVNWWLNQRMKLQANYAHTQVKGGPLATNGSYGVDGVGLRAQLDW